MAIAAAVLRRWSARLGDLLTILVALPILLLSARAWVSGMAMEDKRLLALGAGLLSAATLTKALADRASFHQTDGALAHHAQGSAERLCLILPLLVAGMLVALAALTMIGLMQPISLALGALAGAGLGMAGRPARELARRCSLRISIPGTSWAIRRPRSLLLGCGISSVVGVLCASLPEGSQFEAFATAGYGVLVVLLTGRVDARSVRYMTMVGRSSSFVLSQWLPGQLALLLPFAVTLALFQHGVAASVAAMIAFGLPVITAIRVLAYGSFSRIVAEWITAILIAAVAFATVQLPPLGPVALVAVMTWLFRRSRHQQWLIA